jgi:hypothetical protein
MQNHFIAGDGLSHLKLFNLSVAVDLLIFRGLIFSKVLNVLWYHFPTLRINIFQLIRYREINHNSLN